MKSLDRLCELTSEFCDYWRANGGQSRNEALDEFASVEHDIAVRFCNFYSQVTNGGVAQWVSNRYMHDDLEKLICYTFAGKNLGLEHFDVLCKAFTDLERERNRKHYSSDGIYSETCCFCRGDGYTEEQCCDCGGEGCDECDDGSVPSECLECDGIGTIEHSVLEGVTMGAEAFEDDYISYCYNDEFWESVLKLADHCKNEGVPDFNTAMRDTAKIDGKPVCKLVGEDGNVFNIISRVAKALREAKQDSKAKEFRDRAVKSESYDEVLRLCTEYVVVQ